MKGAPGFTDFRLRTAHIEDAERLSAFYASLSPQSRHFFEPYQDTSIENLRNVITRGLDGVDVHFLALDSAQTVFAHAFFMQIAEEIPHLGIGLREEYQSLGMGGVLLTYLIGVARYILRKRAIGLTVMKENCRAVHLYQKMGFQIVRDDVTFRSPGDSYEMHRPLTQST